jgi:hypothetical protein
VRLSLKAARDGLRIVIAMRRPEPVLLLALRTRAESIGRTELTSAVGDATTLLHVTVPVGDLRSA